MSRAREKRSAFAARLSSSRVLALAVLAGLAAITALVPPACAATGSEPVRYVIRAPGMLIGRELFETRSGPGPGERSIEARAWADFPRGGRFRLRQRLTFDVLNRLSSYDAEIESPLARTRARASVRAGVCTMSFTSGDSTRSRTVRCPADAVILDPFFANHYQALIDRFFTAGMSSPLPESVFVMTPQTLEARTVELREIQGEVGQFNGRTVTARRVEISMPKQDAQIWFDEGDGRVYRVRLVTQLMDLDREGFRSSPRDTLLPPREPALLHLPAFAPDAFCTSAQTRVPSAEDPVAVALLLPDGGPPDAPAGATMPLIANLARSLSNEGIAAITIDPSSSRCKGAAALPRCWVDPALAVIDSLRAAGIPAGRIFVVGHGLGAVAAARLGAREDPMLGGMALLAPPQLPPHEWFAARAGRMRRGGASGKDLGWSAADWSDMDSFDLEGAVARSRLPVFIVAAEKDAEAGGHALHPFSRGARTSRRIESESVLLAGLDHDFGDPGRPALDDSLPLPFAHDLAFWIRAVLPLER